MLPFIWLNLNPFYPRMLSASLVEIGPLVMEKKILKSSQFIFTASKLSPLRNRCGLIWIPLTQGGFVLGWNWPSGSGEEDFWKSSIITIFKLSFPRKGMAYIWTNWNPLHARMFCVETDRYGQTDDWKGAISNAPLSFQLRWHKNNEFSISLVYFFSCLMQLQNVF